VLFVPEIDKDLEYPENYFEIQDEDIEGFKVAKAAAKLKAGGKGKSKAKEEDNKEDQEDEDAEEAAKTARSEDLMEKRCIARKNAKTQNTDTDGEFA